MHSLHEHLIPVFDEVVNRNPGETEFHQSVREVFESLGPVVAMRTTLIGADTVSSADNPVGRRLQRE